MQVFLTPTHLGIAMEYAAGGELFDRIVKAGRFSEDEARFFFQQLISGVKYCHSQARALPFLLPKRLCSPSSFGKLATGKVQEARGMEEVRRADCGRLRAFPSLPDVRNSTAQQLCCFGAGRLPPGPEAGEHVAGPPPGAAA